ncbi:uncharacterized protein LOC142814763 [Rhipicephalus microplus]|uniref:uncharacterized protein LOC142814763 n=1 Tax=Rhipicephalus microplus TaxID=6941 RepID=UPI003F6CAE47
MYRTPPSSREPSPLRGEDTDANQQQRTSRRQQSLPPEYGLLQDKARKTKTMTSTAATMTTGASQPTIVIHQPREPPTFHASSFEDPETWLETYDRVAALNHWDNEEKLRRVYFYLEDTARTWLENRESTLRTWDVFCGAFLQTFASVARKERAAALLETRVQLPNEKVGIFTEEMTRLFRHADPDMPEEKKVRFLMRGVKQELSAGLMRNPPNTVEEFVSEATTIEKTLDMRTRQYNRRLTPECAAAQASDSDDLRETIRAIVREELRKLLPSAQPQVDSIADIVREEVRQSLRIPETLPPEPETMSYAAAVRHNAPPRPRQNAAPSHFRRQTPPPPPPQPTSYRSPAGQRSAPRKTDVWRAPDNRPLCYHCGEAGHTYRRCQYRQMGLRGFAVNAPRPQPGERPRDITDYLTGTRWTPRSPSRSPSPSRRPSPHHRQYSGPTRGRSPSPYPGN